MKELATQKLRHYALQQELSHKAGRRTFLARDLYTKTPAIVKILQFDRAFEWDALKLFRREADILQQLDHSAIPQYKDSFEAEIDGVHSFVLVQTYIPAPSLQKVVETGKLFSEAEVTAIAQQLLTTLSYLHQQLPPVIHRDLKPSNILISEPSPRAAAKTADVIERNVYLVDFGAVQVTASKSSGTVTVVGSYGYMPLEQFLGQTTPVSDLYSLGMTLLYLVTGMHPSELPQIDGRIQIDQVGRTVGLSNWFIRWLSQMSAPYSDQRFESAAIALLALNSKDDGSGCYFSHLRPDSSHLHIYRQKDELKIISKSSSRNPYLDSLGCLLLTPFLVSMVIPFTGTPAAIIIFSILNGSILLDAFQRHRQGANEYNVISISRASGICVGTARGHHHSQLSDIKPICVPSPFSSIKLLTYNPGYTFTHYYNKKKLTVSPSHIHLPPKLSIHAEKQEYSIEGKSLSKAEQLWIDKELDSFLGLPLQRIHPTGPGKVDQM
ncbi:protein kinase domain [Synechococcus sp. PCC 7335]|uniref:serine/threonine protein kinase n=1 Tax=Synechococcus sp. (strain ATCC 29403 / PCC 7335) TaxID=91464 RepID=UPI00017EE000|nr:serine/threonine-protein kinase [Synechococcus sp. PCC 7335]EDX86714.1 protein kinase domain [Synechococcus sp. PCC 7335]